MQLWFFYYYYYILLTVIKTLIWYALSGSALQLYHAYMHIYGSSAVIAKGSKLRAGAREEGEENKMKFKLFLAPNQNAALKCKIRNAKCAW